MLAELLQRMDEEGLLDPHFAARVRTDVDAQVAGLLPLVRDTTLMSVGEFGRTVHAEMAALLDTAKRGVPVDGCTLYSTTFPCHNCTKHIAAAGPERHVLRCRGGCNTRLYRMALSLRLDTDTERLVTRLARMRGQTKSEVVREALRALSAQQATRSGPTLYDAIAPHVGCFDSGGMNLSEKTGRRFASLLGERRRGRRTR
jgi:hypothetical protein